MKIVILFLFIVIVIFGSCNLSENARTINSANHEKVEKSVNISNLNNGTNTQLVSNENAEIIINLPETYFGRWGGTSGGLFEINKLTLHNVLNNKTYKYELVEVRKQIVIISIYFT